MSIIHLLTVLGGTNRIYLVTDGVTFSRGNSRIKIFLNCRVFSRSWVSEPKQITLSVLIGTVVRNFGSSLELFVLFGLLRDHRFRNLLVRFMSEDLVHIIRAGPIS